MQNIKSINIEKVKNQLLKLSPDISHIEVQLHGHANKKYKSIIRVTIPRRRPLIATKDGDSKASALDKAHKAMIKQIKKGEKRKARRQSIRRIEVEQAA